MQDFRELIKPFHRYRRPTRFQRMLIGKYHISIQANEFAYCTPRETLDDIYEYIDMEFAILDESGEFVDIFDDSFFKDWKHLNEIKDRYDGQVGAYIEIDIIQSLCDYIDNKVNLRLSKEDKEAIRKSFNEIFIERFD